MIHKGIAAFQTLGDVEHQAKAVDAVYQAEICEAFEGLLRLGELVEIVPRNGDLGYYRGIDQADGQYYFIKSVGEQQTPYYQRVASLEMALSTECDCVLQPIPVTGRKNRSGSRSYFAWPYVSNLGGWALDVERAHTAGRQVAQLHQAMARLEDQALLADGARRKQAIFDFLSNEILAHKASHSPFDLGIPDFARLIADNEAELRVLADSGLLNDSAQLIHGDLNLGNIIYPANEAGIIVIDFEESLTSFLPGYFDLAFFLERNVLYGERSNEDKVDIARSFISGYREDLKDSPFPDRDCLGNALTYSLLRSIYVLVERLRMGLSSPASEWQKLAQLRQLRLEYRPLLIELTGL